MKKCPCKGCDKRTVTCHGFCEGYKAWKVESDQISIARDKKNKGEPDFNRVALRKMWRRMKER